MKTYVPKFRGKWLSYERDYRSQQAAAALMPSLNSSDLTRTNCFRHTSPDPEQEKKNHVNSLRSPQIDPGICKMTLSLCACSVCHMVKNAGMEWAGLNKKEWWCFVQWDVRLWLYTTLKSKMIFLKSVFVQTSFFVSLQLYLPQMMLILYNTG